MSDSWIKANSRHPDNCQEYDVIFADVVEEKIATLQQELQELKAIRKQNHRMAIHRDWLTLNQPKEDYGNE